MGDYFRGWKRKTGLVTLVMACLFMAVWVSGQFRSVDIELPAGTAAYGFTSKVDGINFYRFTSLDGEPLWTTINYSSMSRNPTDPWSKDHIIEWRWDWAGFHIGESRIGQRYDQDWMIPYWSIVCPLTLLSAWLLLSRLTRDVERLEKPEDH